MFDSSKNSPSSSPATGYFIDPVMTQVVFLAAKLQKPLLLEGARGQVRQDAVSPFRSLLSPQLRTRMSSGSSATAA
jgi:MoxR-like ATPase